MKEKAPFADCTNCPLRNQPFAPPQRHASASMAIIGEAPGAEEVAQQAPFVGQSGQLLEALIKQTGHHRKDFHITNTVLCRPPNNRTPTRAEIHCCRRRLLHEIAGKERCLALGKIPMQALMDKYNYNLSSQRGIYHPIEGIQNGWFLATFHPAAVLRMPRVFGNLKQDLRRFLARGPVFEPEPVEYEIWDTPERLEGLLLSKHTQDWVFDLETDSLDWREGAILGVGLYNPKTSWPCIIVPEHCIYDEGCRATLIEFFRTRHFTGHNAKFDAHFIEIWLGVRPYVEHDTMLMHYALDETRGTHGLKELTMDYFGVEYEAKVKAYVTKERPTYRAVPEKVLFEYLARDLHYTARIKGILSEQLVAQDLYHRPYQEPLMAASRAITALENNGIPLNLERLKVLQKKLAAAIIESSGKLRRMAGDPKLNPNSFKQLAVVLYDKLQMPVVRTAAGTNRTTCEEALRTWQQQKPHPFIDELLTYRGLQKTMSSFVKPLIGFEDEGRTYPTYMLHASVTGRLAATDPAILTIARPEDVWSAELRQCFAPKEGRVLVQADYSQAEFRVWGWISKDPALIALYQKGSDIHTGTAEAFGSSRVLAKNFNFGFIYGGGEYAIAGAIGLSVDVARGLMHRYSTIFKKGIEWSENQFNVVRSQGYVEEPIFKRRRRFPLITDNNINDIRKQARNAPVQALASDITLWAMVQAQELIDSAQWLEGNPRIVLFMHDAIMIEVDQIHQSLYEKRLTTLMEAVAGALLGSDMPFVAEAKTGRYWL